MIIEIRITKENAYIFISYATHFRDMCNKHLKHAS